MKELNPKAEKLNQEIVKEIDKGGAESEKLVEMFMSLREFFIESEDPTVTKVLRLTAEHLEEYGTFELNIQSDLEVIEPGEEEVEEEEEAEKPVAQLESYTAEENLKYLLTLCMEAENKYNRVELFEIRDNLMNW